MAEYRVVWEMDIERPNAEEAARHALEIQRDEESIATVFTVTKLPNGKPKVIDLGEHPFRNPKKTKKAPLDLLATQFVADSGSPNLYFVSSAGGRIQAVFVDYDLAVEMAESLYRGMVEDREHGTAWSYDGGGARQIL